MRRLVTRKSILPLAGILILAVVTSIGLRSAKADMIYRLLNRTAVSAKREAAKPTPTRAQVETRKSSASAFQQVVDLSAGSSAAASQPSASILADLNGDGISDLVLASSSGTLDVRLGTAGGGFQAAKSFRVEGHVDAMASGDFTSDGKLDVLVADTGADSLFILVGDGTGNLPEAQRVALNSSPSRLLVKDFVGDRRAELVVSTGIGPQTELLLWQDVAWTKSMSDSELQFVKPRTLQLPPARLKISTIGAVTRIDAGYVDADSFADILLVSEQQIQVLHGAPNSPFQKIDSVTSDSVITASASGDFNGDARLELAVLESGSEAAVIYGVDAAGQYREIQKVNVGPASGLLAADVNGDRTDDLVVLPKHARKLSILLGGSQDALGTELSNDLKVQPAVVAAGWLDSDTSADLVVAGRRALTVMLTGQLPASTTQGPVGESPIVNVVPAEIDVLIPEGECVTIPLAITIVPTVYRPMDIFLLVDASNSFTDNITNFINDGSRFVQQLVDLRGDIRLGVGTFKDYPISPFGQFLDHAYRREIDFRQVNIQNRAALSNAITRITTGGGGDDPESQLPALYQAATGEGQVLGGLLADIAPNQQASFRQNFDVEKVVVLITDSNFHNAGDPGNAGGPTYPGPTFTDTIAALRARGVKVVGIAAGGPHGGDPAITVAALQQIATATSTFARRDIDANGDGTIDVQKGDPLVVGPPTTNINLKDVIISAVRGFDLPVPLTLEFDRDCSPLTHDFSPVTLFVDPLTGGTYTFDLTFCAPCPSAPFVCRLETKIILDEIIRVRVPTTITAVRPVATVNPGALAFGDVCVGATATQTLTFGNTGNGPYTINALNSSNPAFTVISTSAALPAVVAPGGTVTATVQFSCATGPGPQAGTLIADTTPAQDCLNLGPLLPPIPLSGNCVLIAGSVSPTAVDFGQVCVGQSEVRTLTVTNTGTGPFTINTIASSNVAFSIDSPALPATVPVGGSVSVVVRFSCPSATGPQSGVITFTTSNATNCPLDLGTVALSGSCIEAAGNVAPAALDFGSVCVGQNATNTFTINNTGNTPLTINTITPSSAAFTVVSPALPVTIAPGGSTTVTVQLTCTSPGPQSATISIGASAFCGAVNVGTVSLTGLCINVAGVVSPTAIDFGSVCVGANTTRTFTVANTGNQPFNLDSIASSNAAFTIVSPALPVAIPAGGSVTVTVQLTCVTPGPQAGSLTLGASSTCGPVALSPVALSGFCASTTGTVAPVAIDFGDVCVGASSTRTFTVTNTGNSPFNLTGITSSSPAFTIISPALPVTIPAGGSTTVTVQLTCTSTGPQSGTISFAASGVCGAVSLGTVSLTGFCANVTGTVAPAVIDFGNVCVGTTATRTFVITNTGNRPFDVTSITSSNPAFAIISPAVPLTIPVGGNATVTVRLTCAAPGPQTGTIGFTANSSCGPVSLGTVSLAGFCAQVACAVSPTNLMFGDVQSGTSRDLTFTVANAGNIPFTITGIASSNPLFSIVSPAFPTTVAPGGSLTVTARFTAPPGSSGPQSGSLTINTISDCGPAACS
ncbi:MAG: choice-of-anchor D domain-containing protein, partial [Acidobacteria bacterium]|nr:choice-of-anchor D domain-containing protein [Acidobacteriota bacterium]